MGYDNRYNKMSYYSETKISKKSYFWVKKTESQNKIRITKDICWQLYSLPIYLNFRSNSLQKRYLTENILKSIEGLTLCGSKDVNIHVNNRLCRLYYSSDHTIIKHKWKKIQFQVFYIVIGCSDHPLKWPWKWRILNCTI